MGCGASSTAAVDIMPNGSNNAPLAAKTKNDVANETGSVGQPSTSPSANEGSHAVANNVAGAGASGINDEEILSNHLGDTNPNVAALRKQLLQGLNEMDKVTHAHTFPFEFPAEKVWAKVSDWNLVYLKSLNLRNTVTVEHHPSDPKILTRKVAIEDLPKDQPFEEALLYISHEERVVHYVTIDGPLPHYRHFMTFKVIPRGPNHCKLVWYSFAYAKSSEKLKEAKEMLEKGSYSAVHLIQQAIQLTN